MKYYKKNQIFKRTICILILFVLMTGTSIIYFPAIKVASAQAEEITDQNEMVEALGLASSQPSRYSPSGKKIDTAQNPLGSDTSVLNRTYQLAFTNGNLNVSDNLKVYQNPVTIKKDGKINQNNALTTASSSSANSFKVDFRETVAVDTDGDGKQEVANIGLIGKELKLYISDFSKTSNGAPNSSKVYTISNNISNYRKTVQAGNPLRGKHDTRDYTSFTGNVIMGAAGDFNQDNFDEIAVGIGNTIYIYVK